MRNVFFFSISAILSQFEIRLMVPSTLTTMGPRWSRDTVVLPEDMSRFVVGLEGAAGRANVSLGLLVVDCWESVVSNSSFWFDEFEECVGRDIVNARVWCVLVFRKFGVERPRRVRVVRMGGGVGWRSGV
jgi:hypothetical protein